MFRTIGRAFLIAILCGSIGQWIVLQSVAWTTMILRSSQQISLVKAVSQTFDGNHACNLCKGLTAAQHSQKKEMQRVPNRPDLICATQPFRIPPPPKNFQYAESSVPVTERFQSPRVPPPRRALA